MAAALAALLADDPLRDALGQNAARRAQAEFSFAEQVDRHLALYHDMLGSWTPV